VSGPRERFKRARRLAAKVKRKTKKGGQRTASFLKKAEPHVIALLPVAKAIGSLAVMTGIVAL
jgi:hypothetical protein